MAVSIVGSPTYQTGSAQTLVVTMPTGLVVGKLLIVYLAHGGTMGAMPDANWNLKIGGSNAQAIAWRYVNGSETSTYTFTTTSVINTITQACALQIDGAVSSGDPFDGVNTSAVSAATTTAAVSLTTTLTNDFLLYFDAKNASRTANVAPSGFTIDSPNPGVTHSYHKTQAAAGATGSLTSSYTSGSNHNSMLAAIKSAKNGRAVISGIRTDLLKCSVIASGVRVPLVPSVVISGVRVPLN